MRLVGTENGEACWNRYLQFIGKANAKLQRIFLDRCDIADAHDFKLFLVALRDTLDHIRHQSPREAVQGPRHTTVVGSSDFHNAGGLIDFNPNSGMRPLLEFAKRSFDPERACFNSQLDAFGNGDWCFTDARHESVTFL